MQKVEGSSPFIRFAEPAGNGGFFVATEESVLLTFFAEGVPRERPRADGREERQEDARRDGRAIAIVARPHEVRSPDGGHGDG
jgi:hypothetical protein